MAGINRYASSTSRSSGTKPRKRAQPKKSQSTSSRRRISGPGGWTIFGTYKGRRIGTGPAVVYRKPKMSPKRKK